MHLVGCSISTTISLKIIPKGPNITCTAMTTCNYQLHLFCYHNREAVEWLNPNYQEIHTNSAARIYGEESSASTYIRYELFAL